MTDVFRVSPSVLGPLGLEQLQDPTLALLELIKNSWDADAEQVTVTISREAITVDDNGHGMSAAEFRARWLTIGASSKRTTPTTPKGRPVIGEKGLGRLATYAIARSLKLSSKQNGGRAFRAEVDWDAVSRAKSLDEYEVPVAEDRTDREVPSGTTVRLDDLRTALTQERVDSLVQHLEFLSAVPGQKFKVNVKFNGQLQSIGVPTKSLLRNAEAEIEVLVDATGKPQIQKLSAGDRNYRGLTVQDMSSSKCDPALAGLKVRLLFMRRTEGAKLLRNALNSTEVVATLDRYHGVRIYRDGINVPPYGIDGNDWAGLEKLRTQRGGPTMTPGNSQLIGEAHVTRKHQHLVITAGRAGFADQKAVRALAEYVRWSALTLATARRARALDLSIDADVPVRVLSESGPAEDRVQDEARSALSRAVQKSRGRVAASKDDTLGDLLAAAESAVELLSENEDTLALYAQLASAGIAATSFAHELRTDFDSVEWSVGKIGKGPASDTPAAEILQTSWNRIKSFVALFQVMPVKIRRRLRTVSLDKLRGAAQAVLAVVPKDKIRSEVLVAPDDEALHVRLIQSEFDAIVVNLVTNAVKAIAASDQRESGRIRVRLVKSADVFEISVADNGCGVSPDVARTMFIPLQGKFSDGTGMGLPIVAFIASRYKGDLSFKAKAPRGYATEFTVRLREVFREAES